jgi:hypothetical protein
VPSAILSATRRIKLLCKRLPTSPFPDSDVEAVSRLSRDRESSRWRAMRSMRGDQCFDQGVARSHNSQMVGSSQMMLGWNPPG